MSHRLLAAFLQRKRRPHTTLRDTVRQNATPNSACTGCHTHHAPQLSSAHTVMGVAAKDAALPFTLGADDATHLLNSAANSAATPLPRRCVPMRAKKG